MKNHPKLLAPVLLVPALVATGAAVEHPTFSPAEGTTVTKRLVKHTETSMDDMTMSMGGQDMTGMMGDTQLDTTTELVAVVTDVYAAVSGGRPTRLRRTFEELASESTTETQMMGQEGGEMEISGSSELEGLSVVFTWDPDAEDYTVAFADDSAGDEALLEGLEEDLDLRVFLPDGDVAEGDTWGVEANAMRDVLAAGGSLKIVPDDAEAMGMMGGNSTPSNPAEFFEFYDGDVTVTYAGTREDEGARLAVMEIQVDVSSAADMTEWMQEMMENMEMPEGMEIEMDVQAFDMEYEFEGTGELLWDLGTGLVHSFRLSGDVDNVVDVTMSMVMGGQENVLEQSMSLSGTETTTLTTGE